MRRRIFLRTLKCQESEYVLVTRKSIEKKSQDVFRQVFEIPGLEITGDTVADDIPTWDSLNHINLILALEEEFGIQFASQEVMSMASVSDLYTLLETKLETRS
jgi:acyl carrier protein